MKIKIPQYRNQISKSVQNIHNLEFLVGRESMNFRDFSLRYLKFHNFSKTDPKLVTHYNRILREYPELVDNLEYFDILRGFVVSMYRFMKFCQEEEVTIEDQLILKKSDNLYDGLDDYMENFWKLGRKKEYHESFFEMCDFVKENYVCGIFRVDKFIDGDSLTREWFGFSLFYMTYLIYYTSFEMSSDNLLMVG